MKKLLTPKLLDLGKLPHRSMSIYLCGPTVYNHIHLGNLRPVIIFDVLHRLLLTLNIKVNYVQNITDIDDKIIAKAQQEKTTEQKIANHYTKAYLANLERYNVLFPCYFPRVSNYIFPIQKFLQGLVEKNAAYQQDGEIFFRVADDQNYGKLSGQKLTQLQTNSRGIATTSKLDKKDFVCWKKTATGISWNSPWGWGRPGWHTECVVFIQEFFGGETIDIHGGGNDLLFPHHENERIQYLAYNNKELSKRWLHVAHIHWQEEKMSKSLGNVILAKHFYQNYGANVFRYLVLNSHYNQVINLTEELIQQAVNYSQKITNLLKKLNFYFYQKKITWPTEKTIKTKIQKEVIHHLADNLNTIKVLYLLNKIITFLNKSLAEEKNPPEFQEEVHNFYFILTILGFQFDLSPYDFSTKLLIKKWENFRANQHYQQADQIRSQLQKKGIL